MGHPIYAVHLFIYHQTWFNLVQLGGVFDTRETMAGDHNWLILCYWLLKLRISPTFTSTLSYSCYYKNFYENSSWNLHITFRTAFIEILALHLYFHDSVPTFSLFAIHFSSFFSLRRIYCRIYFHVAWSRRPRRHHRPWMHRRSRQSEIFRLRQALLRNVATEMWL